MSCYVCSALVGERLTVRVIAYAVEVLINKKLKVCMCWFAD